MTFNERCLTPFRIIAPFSFECHYWGEFSNICLILSLKKHFVLNLFKTLLIWNWIIRIAKESLRQTILMRLWYENPAWWFWLSSQTLWSLWKTKMESDYLKNWEIKRSRQRFFNPLRHTYVQRHHKCVVYLWL